MLKSLKEVIKVLEEATRLGTETDEPEGARYVQISETLVEEMLMVLRATPLQPGIIERAALWRRATFGLMLFLSFLGAGHFETIDGRWHWFFLGRACYALTDEQSARVIWGY